MEIRLSEEKKQKHADAIEAPEVFWQQTAGGNPDLDFAEQTIRDGKLSSKELHRARLRLPPAGPGTTGQRVRMIDRLLKSLEHEASH